MISKKGSYSSSGICEVLLSHSSVCTERDFRVMEIFSSVKLAQEFQQQIGIKLIYISIKTIKLLLQIIANRNLKVSSSNRLCDLSCNSATETI